MSHADRGPQSLFPTGVWNMFPISQRTEMIGVTQKSTGFTVEVKGGKAQTLKAWVLESELTQPLHSSVTLRKKT